MSSVARFSKGGVHPHDCKQLSAGAAIQRLTAPEVVVVPLAQHLGAPAKPVVEKGADVLKGQVLAEAAGVVSARVHSPVSGKVKRIFETPAASGDRVLAIEIANDGKDQWVEGVQLDAADADPALTPAQVLDLIKDAGVVGLGGAAFPTQVKLAPPPGSGVDTLVLNGAECEPYLTADHRLMLEQPREVIAGVRLMMKVLGVKRALIGLEDNKQDAFAALTPHAVDGVEVKLLRTRYPQGAEKQLVEALTGRRVPPGKLPFAVKVVVQNVGTAFAVFEAVARRKPLVERVVTVTGGAVASPANFLVPLGTPVKLLLEKAGLDEERCAALICGGPMMGRSFRHRDIPVVKATSGILALTAAEFTPREEQPCIRCGRCVDACPMSLVPCDLAANAEFSAAEDAVGADSCMECGSCQFVCPSRRFLVQWIRLVKAQRRRLKK